MAPVSTCIPPARRSKSNAGPFGFEPTVKRPDPTRNLITRIHVYIDTTTGPGSAPTGTEADRDVSWSEVNHHEESSTVESAQIDQLYWTRQFDGGWLPRPGHDVIYEFCVEFTLDAQNGSPAATCEGAVVVRHEA